MLGSYEFPGFPMTTKVYGVQPGGHIPGAVLERYLTDFAREFHILERIEFDSTVTVVESVPSGWRLVVKTHEGERTMNTTKLIVATGLTSTPNIPDYIGLHEFGQPFFHAKDFCKRAHELDSKTNVVVVGGAKSAFDVAYALAAKGTKIDLIIRPDGHGPVWITPRYVTPLRKRIDTILNIRCLSWFSPCPWGAEDGYPGPRRFLNHTAIGRFLLKTFWKVLGAEVVSVNGYDDHPELAKLKPWNSAFWTGSGLSILNYDTPLFEMVKDGRISVHVDDIHHLEPGKVVLSSGLCLTAGALVCSTGWRKESSIRFVGLSKAGLGLELSEEAQSQLASEFDRKVLDAFPVLKDQPQLRFEPPPARPLRYYRFMVPPAFVDSRNLAFAGMVSTVSTSICATIQGLWISDFLDGNLKRLPETREQMNQEIMLHTQWGKWRYPCGYGASLPDIVFEGIPYADMLLRDMSLRAHRKSSLFAELTSPYTPKDYADVFGEWQADRAGTAVRKDSSPVEQRSSASKDVA